MNEGKKIKDDGLRDKHQNGHCFRPPPPSVYHNTAVRVVDRCAESKAPPPEAAYLHSFPPILFVHHSASLRRTDSFFRPVIPPEEVVGTGHSCLLPSLLGALCICFWVMDILLLFFQIYLLFFFLFSFQNLPI